MIIRIQSSGGSFRGAGQYYLHDKSEDASLDKELKPQTAERVWFAETRNCMNNDPFRALDEMWGVAEDQAYLKMQAGVKRGGRVCEEPVKTMSLSWHKDDAPSPEHMIEAADAFLKHMKWDEHQAVLVGHNDTDHRHIHIILNRVNPETGRTMDDFREQKRAQSWALDYEREHGQVRCENREANAQKQDERQSKKQTKRANDNQQEAAPTQQAEQANQAESKQAQQAESKTQEQTQEATREAMIDQSRAIDEKQAPVQLVDQGSQQQVESTNKQQPEQTADQQRTSELAREAADEKSAPSVNRAANDHLPHNVIMLMRPSEREFSADEQQRAEHAAADRVELKAEQRTEREAFFNDGAKLFKATRHAVYDEVRQEYKSEWRDFYKDSDAARVSAEAASETAIGRAFHFGKSGQWEQARDAFNDRDSVRDATEKDLAGHKADLKQRQNDDLSERQHDACDALRQVRDVQYHELLQRQRDERAAFKAGETLQALGIGRERQDDETAKALPEKAANENRSAEATPVQQQASGPSLEVAPTPRTGSVTDIERAAPNPSELKQDQQAAAVIQALDQAVKSDTGGSIDLSHVQVPAREGEAKAPARGVSDLAAGGIGALANYLADQLGELFAPTPPEVREANAKAEAKADSNREAERPARDDKAAAYDAIIESAVRAAEEERARHGEAWWKERDKGKGFERGQ